MDRFAQAVVDTVREPLLVLDDHVRVVRASHSFYDTFRVSPEDTLGRRLDDLGSGQWDIPRLHAVIAEIVERDTTVENLTVDHEFPHIGRRVMQLNARRLRKTRNADGTEGETYVLLAIEDVTERVAAESQAAQASKMEALGNLAGGIAHEFNNLLLPIIMLAELARDDLAESDPSRERLGQVVKAATQAKELVGRILAFSRAGESDFRETDLATVVRETLDLLRVSLPSSIRLVEQIEPTGPVMGDAAQIHVALINLTTNAVQAMRGGGELTVSLAAAPLPRALAGARLRDKDAEFARISVADTGCGISPNVRARLFDPFFTTREVGDGSGMGLSVVHGIVTRHNGEIAVYARDGGGTSFDLYLPLADTVAPAAA